jgi:D-sedoheptulose 7-phosphate isomerase
VTAWTRLDDDSPEGTDVSLPLTGLDDPSSERSTPPDPALDPDELTAHRASLRAHISTSLTAISLLEHHVARLDAWGDELARLLLAGGRVLVAGNGGSAALAQHLTAELVGRYHDDRPAFSALALHAETSTLTAVANDYGYDAAFARQVEAHGRPGDVLVLLSTSGSSSNLLAAADAARRLGLRCLAMTGPAPNPLVVRCHDAVALDVESSAAVQEAQQVAVHLLCAAFDRRTVPS